MATRINHMAITSAQWPLIGRFYEAVFGLKAAGKSRPLNGFTVGDGYVGLNINPRRDRMTGCLDHFGVVVDDLEATVARMRTKWGVDLIKRPSTRPFAAYTAHDPDGNFFDVVQKGESTMSSLYAEQEKSMAKVGNGSHADKRPGENAPAERGAGDQLPAAHIYKFAIRSLNAGRLADFYADVLGLAQVNDVRHAGAFKLSDGRVTIAIFPWAIGDFVGTSMLHAGADHIGFKVESLPQFKRHLQAVIDLNPLVGPMPIGGSPEAERRKALFAAVADGGLQIADPDGVWIDVSE